MDAKRAQVALVILLGILRIFCAPHFDVNFAMH
jgi:hypothetical protein